MLWNQGAWRGECCMEVTGDFLERNHIVTSEQWERRHLLPAR